MKDNMTAKEFLIEALEGMWEAGIDECQVETTVTTERGRRHKVFFTLSVDSVEEIDE